jgi:hypothetical protein
VESEDRCTETTVATISDKQWRWMWWIATMIHTTWVLGLIAWTITWSDVQACGDEGFMGLGAYPCWQSAYRLGLWSFVIPLIGLGGAAVIPGYVRTVSPVALRTGAPIWRRLAFGSAMVVGALIATSLYLLWLMYRFMTTDIP